VDGSLEDHERRCHNRGEAGDPDPAANPDRIDPVVREMYSYGRRGD